MYAANWHAMRGFSRDPSVTQQRIKPGTVRRIAHYARPYRLHLTFFLVMAALAAVATVAVPLLLRSIVNGILAHNTGLVVDGGRADRGHRLSQRRARVRPALVLRAGR